jgi:phosphoribosyl-ATP pyrophosphohydrolase
MSDVILQKLYDVLLERKNADPGKSYVASLYAQGTERIIAKVIEESKEAVAEALARNPEKLKEESADLLFHLMVLWADQDVRPEDVLDVLEKRFGTGGHAEKASRKN